MDFLLKYILGVDPEALKAGTDWGFRLDSRPEGLVCLLLLIASFAFSGWIYKKERHNASIQMRVFLAIIRGMLLVIALLVLFEPVIAVEQAEQRRGVVVVMVDESRSMSIRDRLATPEHVKRLKDALGDGFLMDVEGVGKPAERLSRAELETLSRMDVAKWLLVDQKLNLIPRLRDKGRDKIYRFSDRIFPRRGEEEEVVVPADVKAEGNVTALGRCVRMAINDLKGIPICAIIVLSDGRSNAGESAASAATYAKTKGIPVFTVALGNSEEPRDVELSGVEGPEVVSVRDYVNIEAFVSSKGYEGRKVTVTLTEEDEEVAHQDLVLEAGGVRQRVKLRFKPEKSGEHIYAVKVTHLPDELLEENNSDVMRIRVIEEKIRVLYVEGTPRWEYRYLKNALIRDQAMEAAVILWRDLKGYFREGSIEIDTFPEAIEELAKFDVVIMGEIPAEAFTEDQFEVLKKFVSEHAGGLMMVSGGRYSPFSFVNTPIADMLPVVIGSDMPDTGDMALSGGFRLELTDAGKVHDVCKLNPAGGQANMEIWQSLPPLFWCYPVKRAKAAATVLAVHPIEQADNDKKLPVIATHFYGSGRVMFVGADSLWRWRWGTGDRYFYRFYSQAIQYLAQGKLYGGQKRFSLSFDSSEVAVGENVRMRARVLDRDFRAVELESVEVFIDVEGLETRQVELKALPGTPGHFEGEFLPPTQGSYVCRAASPGEAETEVGSFEVRMPRREFADPRMDEVTLKALAEGAAPGGAFLRIDELADLPDRVQSRDEDIFTETEIVLWDSWRLLLFFTLLITLEWGLRRWCRML